MILGSFASGFVSNRVAALVAKLRTVPLISGTACAQFSPSRDIVLVTDSGSMVQEMCAVVSGPIYPQAREKAS